MRSALFALLLLLISDLIGQPLQVNDSVTFINATFLGGETRSYYGNIAPDSLNVIWKTYLGKGKTTISRKSGEREWAGAGWTGQPLMVQEGEELFLIQGAFDHKLKKINATTGEIIWENEFDDVIKGTGTLWYNPHARNLAEQILIFQGSRLGYGKYLDNLHIPSYRCISYYTGEELWRYDVKQTSSYSRDVDASCLVIDDTLYIGLENSRFTLMDPRPDHTSVIDSMIQPRIIQQYLLYEEADVEAHRSNVVTEGSIAKLNHQLFIPSGVGRVWAYDMNLDSLIWNFYTGSDIDGSAVISENGKLFVSIEKQYIPGKGGAFMIQPTDTAPIVEWFFPTPNTDFAGWKGGVIGTISINDQSNVFPDLNLAAFSGIDSLMYVVNYSQINQHQTHFGPNLNEIYPMPELFFKYNIGRSISTPLIIGDKIVACSYNGIYLFQIHPDHQVVLIDYMDLGEVEATPFVYDRRIYIASRNGYLYCLGDL